jgi:hypothetical protein
MEEIKVYVASPYTLGDPAVNVRFQMEISDKLIDLGFIPFTPLYYHFQHMFYPRHYTDWLRLDFVWLGQCDCVLRFHMVYDTHLSSSGADKEEEEARRLGIPIFYSVEELVEYYKQKKEI